MNNAPTLMVTVATFVMILATSRLRPAPESSLYLPMIIFSAGYSVVAFVLGSSTMGWAGLIIYAVFYAAGLVAGIQLFKMFNFFQHFTGSSITAFWILFPISLFLGVVFYGLLAGVIASEILSHTTSWQLSGISFGMTVGAIASCVSYGVWRIGVKWVWR
jgi:hypothetical protein